MSRHRLAPLLALVFVVAACSSSASTGDIAFAADVHRAAAPQSAASSAAQAINAFGVDLYRRVAAQPGNLVLSPSSVAIALAMARAGAGAETAAQMDAVLRGVGSDAGAPGINALDLALAGRSGTFKDADGKELSVTLRIANAPFAQRGMTIEPSFLAALASRFGAGVRLVDYKAATEAARQAINAWVASQTEDRIRELIAKGLLTPDARLTLVNAIYLKAPWQTPFSPESTADRPFTRADGTVVQVPTMSNTTSLSYAEGTGWRAVQLPYVGGSLAMMIIVPDDLATFESGVTADRLQQVSSALEQREVNLTLPKFSIETATQLDQALAALGMPLAFDPERADFSGITKEEQLFISAVVHQANIDVDEKGTEAAAATAVLMAASAAPAEPVTMHVDRPFLFVLRDVPTGAVLFLGRVADPSARS